MSNHYETLSIGESAAEIGAGARFRTTRSLRIGTGAGQKSPVFCLMGMLAAIVVGLPHAASANAPSGHYVVTAGSGTGNGTVYDTKSKLTWQQTAAPSLLSYADAKTLCTGVGASLGGTGWRLPTLKELVSIVDYSQPTGPMIDLTAFPSTPSGGFWSSSPYLPLPSNWLLVDFGSGGAGYGSAASGSAFVRCVR